MNIRLIATDIDGTILPPGGAVSPATRHVVAQCRLKTFPSLFAADGGTPTPTLLRWTQVCLDRIIFWP